MSASRLILTRGIPGSGKSTWSKYQKDTIRVSRDDLRAALFNGEGVLPFEQEQLITQVQQAAVKAALADGRTVIVDDTNLRAKYVKQWLVLARDAGAEVEFKDFPIDPYEAIERDDRRARTVGAQVILGMYQRFMGKNGAFPPIPVLDVVESVKFAPYVPGGRPAFSFDIDGTLANHQGLRSPYDATMYHVDTVYDDVRAVLWILRNGTIDTILLSGRSEDYRAETEEWLARNTIPYDALFMRPSGDNRRDDIVKSELIDQHISDKWNVIMHFDDRQRVVDGLRAKGMRVAQVQPGDF